MPGMILTRLKSHTQASHARVEALLDVMREPLTLGHYRALLESLHALYAPLEAELDRHPLPADFEWDHRRKRPLLELDLGALNLPTPRPAPHEALPELSGGAHAAGCLYVLEGATLGGQLIRRHLARQLGLDQNSGAAFFGGYGEQTGTRWQAFGRALTHYAEHGDSAAMLDGAERTFAAFEGWLGRRAVVYG